MKKFTIQIEKLKTTSYYIFTKKFLNDECPICFDHITLDTRAQTGCNHSFCIECIKEYIIFNENKKILSCPCCRKSIKIIKLVNKIEMEHIKKLVNVPEFPIMRFFETSSIERRATERRDSENRQRINYNQERRLIITRPSSARI
jgi:hypothetical protein